MILGDYCADRFRCRPSVILTLHLFLFAQHRQDVLTLQMLRIMDKLWKEEGLDLRLNAYGCVATGDELGMIEVVLNASTTASVNKERGGSKAVLYKDTLTSWLAQKNPSRTCSQSLTIVSNLRPMDVLQLTSSRRHKRISCSAVPDIAWRPTCLALAIDTMTIS